MRAYAGIGSRETPAEVLALMTAAARELDRQGWTLRSGGAKGADTAFAQGVSSVRKQIFTARDSIPEDAFGMAADAHPAWGACSDYARRLHARNVMQVLGHELDDPSKFVLCWTPDGAETAEETSRHTGGTGQAIRIACMHNVPVFNLACVEVWNRVVLMVTDNPWDAGGMQR
jgi:hypothetical protein